MSSFKFKSSGIQLTPTETTTQVGEVPTVAIGIKTPMRLGTETNEGILSMNFDLASQIQDNFRNLVLTNWGERLALYNYGANLGPLMTELSTNLALKDSFENEAVTRIGDAVKLWMPFIQPKTFTSSLDQINNKNTAIINVTITYDIPALQVTDKRLLVTLYAI